MQLVVSIEIAWRSPVLALPPSIGAFSGIAYGPGSLSSAYVNVAGYRVCVPGTVMNGIPMGPPFQSPDPKSAWAPVAAPMVFTYVEEFAATGNRSTGAFQILSAGRTWHVPPLPVIVCALKAHRNPMQENNAKVW